ncbi:MAG: hypothetical protein M3392_06440 [Actinomycetota bacterium]|nr:hypothetical protein [Actinomycetota bacterium]
MTAGRYTALFTGLFDLKQPGEYPYLTVGEDPAANRRSELRRGRPPYERMGREIRFEDLPEEVQAIVLDTYQELWGL